MKRRLKSLSLAAVLLTSVLVSVLAPGAASAYSPDGSPTTNSDIKNASYVFLNRSTINVTLADGKGTMTFVSNKIYDGGNAYTETAVNGINLGGQCKADDASTPQIKLNNPPSNDTSDTSNLSGELSIAYEQTNDAANCTIYNTTVSISNSNGQADYGYEWNGNDIVQPSGQISGYDPDYVQSSKDPSFYLANNSPSLQCNTQDGIKGESGIVLDSNSTNSGTLYCFVGANGQGNQTAPPADIQSSLNGNSYVGSTHQITIGGTQGQAAAPGVASGVSTGSSSQEGADGGDTEPTCADSGFSLSWATCTFISGLADFINKTYTNIITPLLTIDTHSILDTTQPYYQVWATFRDLADVILVITLLVIVYGEAAGGETVMSAYNAKKLLPRVLIVAILINISIYLTVIAVDISNVLGHGVYSLLISPFSSLPQGLSLNLGTGGGLLADLALGGGAIWAHFLGGGFIHFLLLGILGPAALAFFAVVLTLIIRIALIYLLVFISPIAFAMYCLPNTEQYFKRWWDLLVKTLTVYPIITALFALSNILAFTLNHVGGSDIEQIMSLIALFAPILLIPFTFRLAGGLIGTVHGATHAGIAQNGAKMMQERRQARAQRRIQDWHNGSLYQNRGLGAVANNVGQRLAVGSQGRYGVGRRGQKALATRSQAAVQETLKNNASLNELRNDDDANAVLALSGGSQGGAREALNDLHQGWIRNSNVIRNGEAPGATNDQRLAAQQERADIDARAQRAMAGAQAVGFNHQNATAALQTMAQNKSRAVMAGDTEVIQNGMDRLSGGNTHEADRLAWTFQAQSREAGRGDIGGTWHQDSVTRRTDRAALATRLAGGGPVTDANTADAQRHLTTLDGIGRTDVRAMVAGHADQLRGYANTVGTMMNSGDAAQRERAAQHLLEFQKNINFASDGNKNIIHGMLADNGIDYNDPASIEAQIGSRLAGGPLRVPDPRAGTGTVPPTATIINPVAVEAARRISREARVYDRETSDNNP